MGIAIEIPTSEKPPRFAILLCGHASEYIRNNHGGVPVIMKGMLGDVGEVWDVYRVVDGEFPTRDKLGLYEGFVITGSYEDAHGSRPWVLQLCNVIREAYRINKKLLGICFGHQVISRALGGKTGRAAHGWELGLKEIWVADAMRSRSYARHLPPSLYVLEAHQDEVLEVPPGAEVLASSPTTGVEIFALGNQVLGVQGHPEFCKDIAVDIFCSYSRQHGIPTDIVAKAKLSLRQDAADTQLLRQFCKSFMKAAPCKAFSQVPTKPDTRCELSKELFDGGIQVTA